MRATASIPIRRVIRGTEFNRRPFNPQNFPLSPSIEALLAQPTWSVRSLLPPESDSDKTPNDATSEPSQPSSSKTTTSEPEITPAKLHHLLKLSALPLPRSPAEEAKMLQTLRSQVHFVKAIQAVDTRGIEPLITIRDETREAIEEETISLETMKPYLALEEKIGPNGTVRRRDVVRTPEEEERERKTWEVDVGDLGVGSDRRRRGRFFYVRRGKERRVAENTEGENEKGTVNGRDQT